MNQELIDMADKAGFFVKDNEAYSPSVQEDHELTPCLKAFAALVAAAEREACAKLVDDIEWKCIIDDVDDPSLKEVVKAIRARGETK